MKFCCDGFKNDWEKEGQGGLSIAVSKAFMNNEPVFWIFSRAVNKGKEDSFKGVMIDTKVTIATRFPIAYCPWCGKKLKRFYRKHWQDIINHEEDLPES